MSSDYHMMDSVRNTVLSFEVNPSWKMHQFILQHRYNVCSRYTKEILTLPTIESMGTGQQPKVTDLNALDMK